MSVIEKFEIETTIRQEGYYRDTRQWSLLRDMWHPETNQTSVRNAFSNGTLEDWISFCQRKSADTHSQALGPFHAAQPVEIIVHGNRALATTLVSNHIRFQYKDCVFELESWAHQQQRLERIMTDDGIAQWKFVAFETIHIRDSVSLPYPQANGEKCLERAAHDIARLCHRTSYKVLAWYMHQTGEKLEGNLPGYDDEQSWKPITERNQRWVADGHLGI